MNLARLATRMPFPYRAATVPGSVELPPSPRRTGADYETDWARRFPARFTRLVLLETVLRPAVAALAQPDRRGLDRLADLTHPDEHDAAPPVIFAANHHSHIDTPLLLTSIPEPWRHRIFVGAAADYFFRNRATSVVSALALNAIPIERTKVTRRSADHAAALLDEGWSLLIYPEGGRSPDGWGQPFRGGAAYLALRCGVPVVPVHIEGTSLILRKGRKRPTPSATTVTFGSPLRPDAGEDSRRFAVRIERSVAALADETATDWYSARLRAYRGDTPSMTGPVLGAWRRMWALGDRSRHGRRRSARRTRRWPPL
ncbi:MAG: lysophospholipid acyltransferase family protein [Acidimicrobiales bacterium]